MNFQWNWMVFDGFRMLLDRKMFFTWNVPPGDLHSYHILGLQSNIDNIINFRRYFFHISFSVRKRRADLSFLWLTIGFPYVQCISPILQFQIQNEEKNTDEISFSKILIKKIDVIWPKLTCLGGQIYWNYFASLWELQNLQKAAILDENPLISLDFLVRTYF